MTNYLLGEGLETKGKTSKGVKNKTKLSLIQSLDLNSKKFWMSVLQKVITHFILRLKELKLSGLSWMLFVWKNLI